MRYKAKQSLTKRVLTGATLLTSISGCLLSGSDLLAVVADEVLDTKYANTKDTRTAIRLTRDLSKINAKKGENRRVKYEDANVGLHAEKGSSNIRVEEERKMRNLDMEFSQSVYTEPEPNDETSKAMKEILGKNQGINTKAIIDAIQKEYWKNSKDYEKNIGMIDRAYGLEGLTSTDKTRLSGILENIVDETFDIQNIPGKIKALQYIFNQPEVNSKLRIKAVTWHFKYSIIRSNIVGFRNKDLGSAIKFLRERIAVLYKVKDDVQLSNIKRGKKNFVLYTIGGIENHLRLLIKKQDPEAFKEKEQKLKNIVKAYEELKRKIKLKQSNLSPKETKKLFTQPQITELAKEIGYLDWLREKIK